MRNVLVRLALGAAVIGSALVSASASTAAGGNTTVCTSTLAPGTYGRVVVPAGQSCLSGGPVTIHGGLYVQSGATLVLGDETIPVHTATITGGVHATDAANVQIHFSTINGGIGVRGGAGPFGGPFGVTFNTIEDTTINGGATLSGYTGFWMGFIRNHVNGPVNLNNNVLADPDGNEYVTNTIHGSLNCAGNSPAPQQGDSAGLLNIVTGQKTGQCTGV
jgi:hypothetical protein